MGLREEIREELEEKEKEGLTTVQTTNSENDSDDKDFHGIGWNILHKKFVEED